MAIIMKPKSISKSKKKMHTKFKLYIYPLKDVYHPEKDNKPSSIDLMTHLNALCYKFVLIKLHND